MLILVFIAQLRHPRNHIINIINIPNINYIRLKYRKTHKYIDFKPGTRPKCRDTTEISTFLGRVQGLKSMYWRMFRFVLYLSLILAMLIISVLLVSILLIMQLLVCIAQLRHPRNHIINVITIPNVNNNASVYCTINTI